MLSKGRRKRISSSLCCCCAAASALRMRRGRSERHLRAARRDVARSFTLAAAYSEFRCSELPSCIGPVRRAPELRVNAAPSARQLSSIGDLRSRWRAARRRRGIGATAGQHWRPAPSVGELRVIAAASGRQRHSIGDLRRAAASSESSPRHRRDSCAASATCADRCRSRVITATSGRQRHSIGAPAAVA